VVGSGPGGGGPSGPDAVGGGAATVVLVPSASVIVVVGRAVVVVVIGTIVVVGEGTVVVVVVGGAVVVEVDAALVVVPAVRSESSSTPTAWSATVFAQGLSSGAGRAVGGGDVGVPVPGGCVVGAAATVLGPRVPACEATTPSKAMTRTAEPAPATIARRLRLLRRRKPPTDLACS
jgi:hypothetical protein